MAKDKNKTKAEMPAPTLIPATTPQPSLDVFTLTDTIGLDDVMTVVTTKAEKYYREQIRISKEALVQAEKDCDAAKAAADKSLQAAAKLPLTADENGKIFKLKKILNELNVQVNPLQPSYKAYTNRGDNTVMYYEISLVPMDGDEDNQGYIRLPMALPDPTKELVDLRTAAIKRVHELNQTIVGWKQKIAEIPSMAKIYKANVVEMKLNSSADGKALLDRLNARLDADLAAGVPLLGTGEKK